MAEPAIKRALLVVDMQEDFCPPNGSLQVPNGRSIIPLINRLLGSSKFALKIATKDWHPPSHVSFAANHPGRVPFSDSVTITNPRNPLEKYTTTLWPVHCVQETPGAALVSELDTSLLDKIIEKGTDPRVEMYSAFYDPFSPPHVSDSGLTQTLREAKITHVYVVGLAGDYCVRSTAADAHAQGFETVVIDQGTKAVYPGDEWEKCKKDMAKEGVKVVSVDSQEVRVLFEQ
ncbi:Isochorismatase-like protein [Apodospora peruviana]|uniref:nicotinamidase n=1 Tax=Apodospora peruviana TaxID=516989 RepID=A0AAE0MGD1_9PEZI|nr:Isochorismatase-like protein [Apodospora peruviana]